MSSCELVVPDRPNKSTGLFSATPYRALGAHVQLVRQYLTEAPPTPADSGCETVVETILRTIRASARKPAVLLAGRFDAGKTRVTNTLLGTGSLLPEKLSPATSVVTLLRHASERPAWQTSPVAIFESSAVLDRLDDETIYHQQLYKAGGFNVLRTYGMHGEEEEEQVQRCAVVYLESSTLECCDIIDTPGYGATSADTANTGTVAGRADLVIYLSPYLSFLDEYDFARLAYFVGNLPIPESRAGGIPTLTNLVVLMTHASSHVISADQAKQVLDNRARRLFRHLEPQWQRIRERAGRVVSLEDFRSRFFPFWAEEPEVWRSLRADLGSTLQQHTPRLVYSQFDATIRAALRAADSTLSAKIANYVHMAEQRERAKRDLREYEKNEPAYRLDLKRRADSIHAYVAESREVGDKFVSELWSRSVSKPALEKFIRDNFDEKDEAKKYALTKFQSQLNGDLERHLSSRSERFAGLVREYLAQFSFQKALPPAES